jgi:hypothetical protein
MEGNKIQINTEKAEGKILCVCDTLAREEISSPMTYPGGLSLSYVTFYKKIKLFEIFKIIKFKKIR